LICGGQLTLEDFWKVSISKQGSQAGRNKQVTLEKTLMLSTPKK
jgi:hypothetical protein